MNKSKLKSVEGLSDFLQSDFAWRRKEINEIRKLLQQNSKTPTLRDSLIRAGITILYAHWEGFVKNAATAYICFVAMQRLRNKDLSANFLAIGLASRFSLTEDLDLDVEHRKIVNFFLEEMEKRSRINWENAITTKSNLTSKTFRHIVEMLDLPYLPAYETKQQIIDRQLLKNRHEAAHGIDFLAIDEDQLIDLFQIFLGAGKDTGLLEVFSNQIVTAAMTKQYLKT